MDTLKKILGAGAIVALIIFIGIPFLKGFWQGLTGEDDSGSGVSTAQNAAGSSTGSSSNDSSSLQTGIVAEKLKRFTDYAAEHGIELIHNKERERMSSTMEQYYSAAVEEVKEYGGFKNGYYIDKTVDIFIRPILKASKTEYPLTEAYYGNVNRDNQPDGYGAIFFMFHDSDYGTIVLIDYMGQFKNGRKNGYGIQFYRPDDYWFPGKLWETAINETKEKGISDTDEEYLPTVYAIYEELFFNINYAFYEGEFKDDRFCGKGNHGSMNKYMTEGDDIDCDTSNEFEITLFQSVYNESAPSSTMPILSLCVGEFKDHRPYNVKWYYEDELKHDGRMKDYSVPIT